MPHEDAMAIILDGRGAHFDPYLVDLLVELEQDIIRVSAELDAKDGKKHKHQTGAQPAPAAN